MSAPFDTAAAIAQANKWTEAGAHLIKARAGLSRIMGDLEASTFAPSYVMSPARCAHSAIEEAFEQIGDEIEAARNMAIWDVTPLCPDSTDEAEWTAHEATCAAIESAVVSVGAFIKKMEMEA